MPWPDANVEEQDWALVHVDAIRQIAMATCEVNDYGMSPYGRRTPCRDCIRHAREFFVRMTLKKIGSPPCPE